MHQIKEFLSFLDVIVGTFWGFTLIEVIPLVSLGTGVLSSIDNIIKILFALVGLIYTTVRMIHFIKISKINRDYRNEELREKKIINYQLKNGNK
jgi:hypothetical protein